MRIVVLLLTFSMQAEANSRIDAAHYQQFWLWAGVKPQPVLQNAVRVYLLQGQVNRGHDAKQFMPQGQSVNKLIFPEVWLVYRVNTLDWAPQVFEQIEGQRQRWIQAGNNIGGIQIDFDARSLELADYGDFLRRLRQRLPADCRISITGLLDWTKTGSVEALNSLDGVVDELIIQTYRRKQTVVNYSLYLRALSRLKIPFKIGLVQHGIWDVQWQKTLANSPYYLGEVIFLVNTGP